MKVSVLIPAHNEEQNIQQTIQGVHKLSLIHISALVPMIALAITSPPMQYILKLLELRLRVVFGF